jgi:hypothetical protein
MEKVDPKLNSAFLFFLHQKLSDPFRPRRQF